VERSCHGKFSGILSRYLRKTTININQNSRSPVLDMNLGHPEYEIWLLPTG
jgi:hypothetical protein